MTQPAHCSDSGAIIRKLGDGLFSERQHFVLRIALVGFGTVGQSVARILCEGGARPPGAVAHLQPARRAQGRRLGAGHGRLDVRLRRRAALRRGRRGRGHRRSEAGRRLDPAGAGDRQVGRHRQQAGHGPCRSRSAAGGGRPGAAPAVRGRGGGRYSHHPGGAGRPGRRSAAACAGCAQRHLQLHADAHGSGAGLVRRCAAGGAGAGIRRGRSDRGRRRRRRAGQAGDSLRGGSRAEGGRRGDPVALHSAGRAGGLQLRAAARLHDSPSVPSRGGPGSRRGRHCLRAADAGAGDVAARARGGEPERRGRRRRARRRDRVSRLRRRR